MSPKQITYKRKPVARATDTPTKRQKLIASKEAACDACGYNWKLRGSMPSRCPRCDSKMYTHLVHASSDLQRKAS